MRDKERAGEEEQAFSLERIPVWVSDFGKRGLSRFFRGFTAFSGVVRFSDGSSKGTKKTTMIQRRV